MYNIYIYQKVGQNDHKSIEIERETDKMGNSCLLLFFLFVYGFYMIFCTNIKKPQNEERLLLNICQEKWKKKRMKTNDFNEQHQQVDKFMCRNGWVHVAFETNPLRGDGLAQNIVSSSNSICLEYIISILEIVKMTSQKNTYKILNYFFPNEHLFVNNKYNNFIWTWSK